MQEPTSKDLAIAQSIIRKVEAYRAMSPLGATDPLVQVHNAQLRWAHEVLTAKAAAPVINTRFENGAGLPRPASPR